MNRIFPLLAMTSALLIGIRTFADPTSAAMNRRQMVSCMTKQMSASKTISYNEATKLCRDQLKSQNGSVATNTAAKPVNSASTPPTL
jgi:hypothetical protein